jgi:hypothetical protein
MRTGAANPAALRVSVGCTAGSIKEMTGADSRAGA